MSDSKKHDYLGKVIVLLPLFVSITFVVTVIVFLIFKNNTNDKNLIKTYVQRQIPEFTVYNADLTSIAFDNATVRNNKWSAINFFASWCVPCIAEVPSLNTLNEIGIDVYGIAWKDEPKDTEEWLLKNKVNFYKYGYDIGEVSVKYGIVGIPETFFIYDDKIWLHITGALTEEIIKSRIIPMIENNPHNN